MRQEIKKYSSKYINAFELEAYMIMKDSVAQEMYSAGYYNISAYDMNELKGLPEKLVRNNTKQALDEEKT